MPRPKKDPNIAAASYNIKNVERAIGFTTALINNECLYHESLAKSVEHYDLSSLEAGMVYAETINLIAPQFRAGGSLEPASVLYTFEEIEDRKAEVREKLIANKQRREAAKH
jgi:hypothetical protein